MKNLIRITIASLLLAIPAWGYVTYRIRSGVDSSIAQLRWKDGVFPLQWRMNPTQGSNVTGSRTQAEVFRNSFQAWTGLSTTNVAFQEGAVTETTVIPGNDGINLVTTNLTAAQWTQLGGGGVIALTLLTFSDAPNFVDSVNRPFEFAVHVLEADIYFNPSLTFTTNTTAVSDRFDLQSVATHEVGHFLGLDHTTIVGSTMFWT
ncbi:MAG: matrixin family metalloprotease, partial [Acidobacteria bacterium]|nr:matrixin family metalloprotease [Acidobacteriota bacterium]